MTRTRSRAVLPTPLAALAAVPPAAAATLEVVVRDGNGAALERETVVLRALATEADRRTAFVLRHSGLRRSTDFRGAATFDDLAPGAYLVDVPHPRRRPLLPPAYHPLAPTPRDPHLPRRRAGPLSRGSTA